jgi:hypothetical protein
MKKILESIKNPPSQYRPVPFWSWNSELRTDETVWQINQMKESGMGGFFMHARGGLTTEYLGKDWIDNVNASIDEAKKLDMHAWGYDENGWPSGFGNGYVNGKGIKYQQKYLRMSDAEPTENVIAKCGSHWFYFDVNPFYVDTLDKDVVAEFIDYAYIASMHELQRNYARIRSRCISELAQAGLVRERLSGEISVRLNG